MALLTAKGYILHTSGTYNSKGEFLAREVRAKLKYKKPVTQTMKDAILQDKRRDALNNLKYLLNKLK